MFNIIGSAIRSNSIQGGGLHTALLNQSGNRSTDIKLKIGYVGNPVTKGNWSAASTYSAGELRAYPINSPIMWRANASVSAAENPPISNSKWDLAVAPEMVQNLGGGKYARSAMQRDEGSFIKLGTFEIGTYALSQFSYNPTMKNYNTATAISTTSADAITIPTTHPSSKTFTIGTGISNLPASSSIGTATESFAIPTTHPTMMSRTLPTGLSLSPGEKVTFYGDASNYFVFVVCRYNSTTGAAYGFSLLHVGTGTFGSWTLKKEVLLRILRTASPTTHYFYGLVQSYDSGTGSVTVNSTRNTGTGSQTGWTVTQAHEPPAVGSSQSLSYNQEAAIGMFHVIQWSGTRISHVCPTDNRGTGFRYIYCDGPDVASPPSDAVIDTYSASSLTNQAKLLFDDLSVGTHTIVGVSVTSADVSSANTRNWIYASTNIANIASVNQQYNYHLFTADFVVCNQGQSIGEIAFNFRESADAGDTLQWMPYHGAQTMTSTPAFTVDGAVVDHEADFTTGTNPYGLKYQDFTTCVLAQTGTIVHPQGAGTIANYTASHTINKDGIDWRIDLPSWLIAVYRSIGYVNLMFLTKAFCDKIEFETGTVYTVPTGAEADVNIASEDLNPGSMLAYNDGTGSNGEPNYALAVYWPDTSRNWVSAFIDNYDGSNIKLYPVLFSDQTIAQGTAETFRGKWYLGNKGDL